MSYILRPPITDLRDLSCESRIISTPWSRIVRGIGLGQHPIGYDSESAKMIERSIKMLHDSVGDTDHYTVFSSALIDLILLAVRSGDTDRNDECSRHFEVTASAFRSIVNPYSRVIAGTILIDATAKLGLNFKESLKGIAREVLHTVDQIKPNSIRDENQGRHGDYERVSAFTAIFFSFKRAGLSDMLIDEPHERISDALRALDNVPTPFFQGRGGSMLIASIALLGREEILASRGTIESVFSRLDQVDRTRLYPAFPSPVSTSFIKVYPLLTMLSAISTMSHPDGYLKFGRDRLQEASRLMAELEPVERTHMGLYYVMALNNLGRLDIYLPDLNVFVEEIFMQWEYIDPGRDYFLYGISYAYLIQLAYFVGRTDLVVDSMIDRMVAAFRSFDDAQQNRINRPYPFSYAVNVLSELGVGGLFHDPHPGYDGLSPFTWVISRLSKGGREEASRLYMLNHALISWALRLRTSGC